MAQQPSKWSHQHNRSAYFPKWKKDPKCTGGTITGPKYCPAALLIHRQLSTITCCDQVDKNCVNISKTEPPIQWHCHCLLHDPVPVASGTPTACSTIQWHCHGLLQDPVALPRPGPRSSGPATACSTIQWPCHGLLHDPVALPRPAPRSSGTQHIMHIIETMFNF